MGVSKDTTRSQEDVISTPLPGETLAMFYTRSRKFRLFLSRPTRSHIAPQQANTGPRRPTNLVIIQANSSEETVLLMRKKDTVSL